MFDPSTLPPIYIKPVKGENFEIKELPGPEFELYVKGERWMNIIPNHTVTIKQLYSHYDIAYGNVLVTGLGFGIAALWIASKPSVDHVTVVERSNEVIEAFLASNQKPDNMTIICEDADQFYSDVHFDCILADHFENEGYQDIIDSVRSLCERVPSHNKVWFWPLEHIYAVFSILQYGVLSEHINYDAFRYLFYETQYLRQNRLQLGELWEAFRQVHLDSITIAEPKIEYFDAYYDILSNGKAINVF